MSPKNSSKPVPHSEREAVLGCIDGRLVLPHFLRSMHLLENGTPHVGSEFLIRMAGGAAALLTERDAKSCLGQLTDAYGVRKFGKMELQLHLGCGKLGLLCGPGGEFEGEYDPASADSLYLLGHKAAELVTAEFARTLRVDMPVTVTVVDICRSRLGLPASRVVPGPNKFSAIYR